MQGWMYAKLRYSFDVFDTWQPPITTWYKRAGDCEDWAILANDWLRDKYVGRFILMFRMEKGVQYGHATYAVRDSGRWVTMGTFGLKKHRRDDIGKVIERFGKYRNWSKYKILDQDLDLIQEKYNSN
jgi:hypothetical protein